MIYHDMVRRLARQIVRDPELTDDVMQTVWAKAWLGLPALQNSNAHRSWLRTVTRNAAIDALRQRRCSPTDPEAMADLPDCITADVEQVCENTVALEQLIDHLGELNALSHEIVHLRHFRGMSYQEISIALDIPIPTIKTRLLRSRRALAHSMSDWH